MALFSGTGALRGFGLHIGARLLESARSTPLYHLASSLFVTCTVLPHATSPRGTTARAVALLVSPLRPERWAVFDCPLVSSHEDFGMDAMPGATTQARLSVGEGLPAIAGLQWR